MHYGKIESCDTANGEGIRITLFVSGCRRHCKGCFNPSTWDFTYGSVFTDLTEKWIFELMKPSYVSGLTLLGGEPMEPENQPRIFEFLRKLKLLYPEKNVWMYTGCTYERDFLDENSMYHTDFTDKILKYVDVLVDGEFIEEKRNLMLKFRGSENQRVIDMRKTREHNEVVLYME